MVLAQWRQFTRPVAFAAFVTVAATAAGQDAQAAAAAPSPAACAALNGQVIGAAAIEAAWQPAGGAAPAYCKVAGRLSPKHRFELRLPATWNGKLHYTGNGGNGGRIPALNPAVLAQGYASVADNTGHDGTDSSFALDDPTAVLNLALLAVPTVAISSKAIVQAYYGAEPRRTYFEGCSEGGREAITGALHYPMLFDGVIAGAPGISKIATNAFVQHAMRAILAPGARLPETKLRLLDQAVLRQCDTVAADGLVDGIVSNWEACRFDPASLRCPGGGDTGETCLSDPQVKAIRTLIEPAVLARGGLHHSGYPLMGSQGIAGQWDRWWFSPQSVQLNTMNSNVRSYFAQDAQADALNWDMEAHASKVIALRDLFDVNDANLQAFERAGGKMIIWTGAADPTTPVGNVARYYRQVTSTFGQDRADRFARLYVMGGVGHCSGGSGADRPQNLLAALDAWVTRGEAPSSPIASKFDPATSALVLSRPLCPYPSYARYVRGDPKSAESFRCALNTAQAPTATQPGTP
ncbi:MULTISPECIES: tannase/feruloyl esterase family alpha/beta hydrolase [unclassified Phenylobacterium]|uniref:tannase/feruloyl esterase family alpha/beta hydrolase n=1 Tax=unclassified Phenylobacterium TaxID=2640670 RepID=UPI00083A84D9|nr:MULTISPECIES: tannase/feruloyl esterase family alpha/beta hydrolase [unclassified Phenylobacterium]